MNQRYFFTSSARISNLMSRPFEVRVLPRSDWGTGDYVAIEITTKGPQRPIELTSGRMVEVIAGDVVVGVLGERFATLETTGTWRSVGDDLVVDVLTGGGVMGACTSQSLVITGYHSGRYIGHVAIDGRKMRMSDYVTRPEIELEYAVPTILLFGTSMSAGKTTAAGVVIRLLKRMGHRVLGAKLTGAGRYRDVLSMRDAGADAIVDFVDAGLPSTVCTEEEYREALDVLMAKMAGSGADVAVVEVGASPMEPYNGEMAIERIDPHVRMRILCALDPYAVVGVMTAYGSTPDLVTGVASNTKAGRQLSEKLSGVRTLNIRDSDALPELVAMLQDRFADLSAETVSKGA